MSEMFLTLSVYFKVGPYISLDLLSLGSAKADSG